MVEIADTEWLEISIDELKEIVLNKKNDKTTPVVRIKFTGRDQMYLFRQFDLPAHNSTWINFSFILESDDFDTDSIDEFTSRSGLTIWKEVIVDDDDEGISE